LPLQGLNQEQQAAACEDGHCLVIAGPGAGKTKTIAAKAARLLCDPDTTICAVTFTKESALELAERILRVAGLDAAPRVIVGTFHRLALYQAGGRPKQGMPGWNILRRMPKGNAKPPRIANDFEARSYVVRAMQDVGVDADITLMMQSIAAVKAGIVTHVDQVADVANIYQEILTRNGKIDFQDLILNANEGMITGKMPHIPVDHMFVDEFQDTDPDQFKWVMHHVNAGIKVTVVGDDDQCQPPGTIITTGLQYGETTIERLSPESGVVACNMNTLRLVHLPQIPRVASSHYTGDMYRFEVEGGLCARGTMPHKWLVRNPRSRRKLLLHSYQLNVGMQLPEPVWETGTVAWKTIRKIEQSQYTGLVYSLDTSPIGTYVADGLVTHNSIYKFRLAMGHEAMLRFVDETRCTQIVLGTNYRSFDQVTKTATLLIRLNTGRYPKEVNSHRGQGGRVVTASYPNASEEASAAAVYAGAMIEAGNSVAVLTRRNYELNQIERACIKEGVIYRRAGGKSILESVEIGLFLDLLSLVTKDTPTGVDHVLAWSGAAEDDLRALHQVVGDKLIAGAAKDFQGSGISEEGRKLWRQFVEAIKGWKHTESSGTLSLTTLGVAEWMKECLPAKPRGKDAEEDIDFARELVNKFKGSLKDRVAAIRNIKEKKSDKASEKAAILSTLHGSKGREWDSVWIACVADQIIPDEDASEEEERRLLYVGITRSKNETILSWPSNRAPSKFIGECGLLTTPGNQCDGGGPNGLLSYFEKA